MLNKLVPAAGLLAVPLAFLYSAPVKAVDCTITQTCIVAIDKARASINTNIDQMDSNIAREVNRARTDIIEALGKQTSSISGQQAQAVETQTRHAEQVEKARLKIAAIHDRSRVPCGHASGSQTGSLASVASGSSRPHSAGSAVPERLKKAWDQADPNAATLPPFDQNITRADLAAGSCEGFAGDPNSARGQMCRRLPGLKINSNPYADADIRAETLFDGPQQKGKEQTRLTVTEKQRTPERDARKAILASLSQAVPPPGVHPSAFGSPQGLAYIGELTEHQAKMSLATSPMRDWDAQTTSTQATKESLRSLLNDDVTALFLQTKLDKEFPPWRNDGVSQLHLAEIQVEKRAGNQDWYKYMARATNVEKAAEIPLILAEQQRLLFDLLLEVKKLNILAGQQLAQQIQNNDLPTLQRLSEAANKTVRQ
jgi:hypothetical protein